MSQKKGYSPPQPNKMPGFTGECALPPENIVSAIGQSGIRYYSPSPEKAEPAAAKS